MRIAWRAWAVAITIATATGMIAAAPPPQASDVKAFFRAGQTFLTWRENAAPGSRYKIYRATRPFRSSEDLTASTLVATVGDFSSLNLMASINRLEASKIPRDQACHIARPVYYVIEEGSPPLTEDTGLFVYTVKASATAYYAVTVVAQGDENRTLAGNTLDAGITEHVQPATAIAQNSDGDYVHWTDNIGTESYPSMSQRPGTAYNFRVRAPKRAGPHAIIGVLHGALFQYNTPDKLRYAKVDGEAGEQAVRVAMDAPYIRGRIAGIDLAFVETAGVSGAPGEPTGWHSAADRVLWTMDWVAQRHAIARDRYALRGESMGGIGAIQLALTRPERFAAIHAYVPAFGREHPEPSTSGSRSPLRFNPYELVKRRPAQDFPFILYTAGRADHVVQWRDKLEFATFAQNQRLGFIFYWDAREHAYGNTATYTPVWGEPTGYPTMDLTRFSLRQSYPAVANLSVNDDVGTHNPLAVRPAERGPLDAPGTGDLVGAINGHVDWDRDTIVDRSDRYELTLMLLNSTRADTATVDITPRRLQEFRTSPNSTYSFAVLADTRTLASGSATADEHGLLQIKAVPITRGGTRLVIRR